MADTRPGCAVEVTLGPMISDMDGSVVPPAMRRCGRATFAVWVLTCPAGHCSIRQTCKMHDPQRAQSHGHLAGCIVCLRAQQLAPLHALLVTTFC